MTIILLILLVIYIISCIGAYIHDDIITTQYDEMNDGVNWEFILFPIINTMVTIILIKEKLKEWKQDK